jgi:hypothetical protein
MEIIDLHGQKEFSATHHIHMIARAAVAALLVALAACASPPREPVRTLSAAQSGEIWFATAGSLVRKESRLVPAEPVVISGELQLPSAAG